MQNPNRKYAIYPILHSRIMQEECIDTYTDAGFGGVVGNISYQKDFDTCEQIWLKTAEVMRKYINKGMHLWIYDEDGYPSGSAGGYLTEKYPEYIAKGLFCYQYWHLIKGPIVFRSDIPDDTLWKAALVSKDKENIVDVTQYLNENNVLYIEVPAGEYQLYIFTIRRLFDGTHNSESHATPRNYINLTNKQATEKFIEMTHEHYKKYLSDEFGKGIVATFTDEPSLIA